MARVEDEKRLAALHSTGLLDTASEPAFDRLTRLAMQLLGTPVSAVSLVDSHRQFFKSSVGLAEPWLSRRETPLSHSFCRHVVETEAPLVVDDARTHPLVHDNPAINARGNQPFELSVSLGAAVYDPHDPRTLEALLNEADEAMYAQKRARQAMLPRRTEL